MIAGVAVAAGLFVVLAVIFSASVGLVIFNAATQLITWGVLESNVQLSSLAAVGLMTVGLVLSWLWRPLLKIAEFRARPIRSAAASTAIWALIAVGLLVLTAFMAEPLAASVWQRQALSQAIVGAVPGLLLAFAITRVLFDRLVLSNYGPISGDARFLPRSLLGKMKSQGLLPQEPWWGFVGNPGKPESIGPEDQRLVRLTLSGWVVGRDFVAELEFFKEVPETSIDALEAKGNWQVRGIRRMFQGPVEVRSRNFERGWEIEPNPNMSEFLGRGASLYALPSSLRRKLLSVTDPDANHVDVLRDASEPEPRLIMASMSNSDFLVAVKSERGFDKRSGDRDQAIWHTLVIRARFTQVEPDVPVHTAASRQDSWAPEPWSDWSYFDEFSRAHSN